MIFLLVSLLTVQTIEVYRARYRPAAELVSIATSALGADGRVTLDARTASLVLNGSPAAIERALALLERMDRPLREVVLDVTVREVTDLESLGVRVAWRTSIGPVSVGTLPRGANGLSAGIDASRSSATTTSRSSLRLMGGGTGVIRTGKALPVLFVSYWSASTTFVPVDAGFEATARVLEDDQVFLELRPFAGSVGDRGELNYIAAATSLTVTPGETVVLAEASRDEQSTTAELTGTEQSQLRRHQIVLVSVDVER